MADVGRTLSVDLELWRKHHVLSLFSICLREESRAFWRWSWIWTEAQVRNQKLKPVAGVAIRRPN
jgi:hypothetical protein